MGTSKRRIHKKIKEILNKSSVNDLNQNAPVITKLLLSPENLSETFQQTNFTSDTINFIGNQFQSLTSKGFKGKSKADLKEDLISKEEFINSILEAIENEFNIDSKILLKSLKITLAKFIDQEFDIYAFSHMLFYEVVTQMLTTDLQETLKDSYENLSYNDIKNMVVSSTDHIINYTVYEKINDFVIKKCSLSDVFELIQHQTSEALFGDF